MAPQINYPVRNIGPSIRDFPKNTLHGTSDISVGICIH